MPEIININMSHPLYQEERELRNKILLRPIGIPDYGWEKYDSMSWHFVAISENSIIGCVVLVPLDSKDHQAQLIQMAVDTSWQGKGIGKQLVHHLINFAKNYGLKEILIHSRQEVTSFYEALGFSVYGDPFEEVGIQHQHLRLVL